MFSGFLTVLLLAGWQMSAERVFDKPVTGSAFYRPRQWSIHSPALVYSPVSLILSSTGAYLKTQETSDTIFDAAYVKCWEVSHIFGKHDRSLRAAIRARPVVEEVWCWRYHASFGVHAYFKKWNDSVTTVGITNFIQKAFREKQRVTYWNMHLYSRKAPGLT